MQVGFDFAYAYAHAFFFLKDFYGNDAYGAGAGSPTYNDAVMSYNAGRAGGNAAAGASASNTASGNALLPGGSAATARGVDEKKFIL